MLLALGSETNFFDMADVRDWAATTAQALLLHGARIVEKELGLDRRVFRLVASRPMSTFGSAKRKAGGDNHSGLTLMGIRSGRFRIKRLPQAAYQNVDAFRRAWFGAEVSVDQFELV